MHNEIKWLSENSVYSLSITWCNGLKSTKSWSLLAIIPFCFHFIWNIINKDLCFMKKIKSKYSVYLQRIYIYIQVNIYYSNILQSTRDFILYVLLNFFYNCKTSLNYVQLCMHVYNSSLREIKPLLIKHYVQLNLTCFKHICCLTSMRVDCSVLKMYDQ